MTIKLGDNKAPVCNVTEVRILWETAYALEYSLSVRYAALQLWRGHHRGRSDIIISALVLCKPGCKYALCARVRDASR